MNDTRDTTQEEDSRVIVIDPYSAAATHGAVAAYGNPLDSVIVPHRHE
jgi:hypothetical protein